MFHIKTQLVILSFITYFGGLPMATAQTNINTNLYEIPLQTIDGKTFAPAELKSKVLLFVNTASECGYTPQYKGLESLFEKYKDKGLLVIGVPCNQFGSQEPGSEKEIKTFCEMKFGVKFPLLKKGDVKGPNKLALYQFLQSNSTNHDDVAWNFEKFLVGRNGKVINRYKSAIEPQDASLTDAIEKALAN